MRQDSRILVCGARGLVGSAIVRRLATEGYRQILQPTRAEVDLTDRLAVDRYLAEAKPEYVFMAAARVGGILANSTYPADFIRDNLAIELNVIDAAWSVGVTKLLMLGSSCIYPRGSPQPIREECLLTGPLEPTNAPYAIAKIAGIALCQSYAKQFGARFISAMPTNLYGPGDNFDLESSHVIPALIRKCHEAKQSGAESVVVWGTGKPKREFLYVDDLAGACVFLMQQYENAAPINVGVGEDISISELARVIGGVVGFDREIRFDSSKPDGAPRKLLDVGRINALGWRASTGLSQGLTKTYEWYLEHDESADVSGQRARILLANGRR
ncbi:MAG: GDP-L-fucose synthase [Gemmatimonadota bacterium]|nr:GDP-L-fucose synthase [Gemmatimonadota bacterium]